METATTWGMEMNDTLFFGALFGIFPVVAILATIRNGNLNDGIVAVAMFCLYMAIWAGLIKGEET